jgi:hypothetical protein
MPAKRSKKQEANQPAKCFCSSNFSESIRRCNIVVQPGYFFLPNSLLSQRPVVELGGCSVGFELGIDT